MDSNHRLARVRSAIDERNCESDQLTHPDLPARFMGLTDMLTNYTNQDFTCVDDSVG